MRKNNIVRLIKLRSVICPKCGMKVKLFFETSEKLQISCPSCGHEGHLPNPYLKELQVQDDLAKILDLDLGMGAEPDSSDMETADGVEGAEGSGAELRAEGEVEVEEEGEFDRRSGDVNDVNEEVDGVDGT